MKKNSNFTMLLILGVLIIFLSLYFLGQKSYTAPNIQTSGESAENAEVEKVELSAGDVIERGSYTNIDGVEFLYDGKQFQITNGRDDSIVFMAFVYGKRADGTYKFLGTPAFYAIDVEQYEEDLEKDGWATEEATNRIRPGGSATAIMNCFSSEMDVDKDGYYDISLVINPINSDGSMSSEYAIESGVFLLKAN